jgi:hypothetical protein
MDQKARCQNMNSNLEKNQDVDHKMYETPNRGIVLELKSLRIKEGPTRHWVFLVKVGAKRKMWTKGLQIHPSYRRQSLVRRIKFDVYQEKGLSMLSKCHREKRNLGDDLLMVDLGNSSNLNFVNSRRNDYNMHTNLPCVY